MNSPVRAVLTFARSRQQLSVVTAVAICLAGAPASAFFAPQVSGSSSAVRINAQNSPIEDVLSALGQKFDLQFQSSINLDKQLTGTYRGSLLQVVSRLLEGYDFIIKSSKDGLNITVLGLQNGTKSPPPLTANTETVPCNTEKLASDMKLCLGKPGFSDVILGGCMRNASVLRAGFMVCQADHKKQQNYDRCSADEQIATMRTVGIKLDLYRSGYCGFG